MILGIDLGTTNSVAAIMSEKGPELIPNALGEVLTPSVIGFDDAGKLLVGRAAKELQTVRPERCASLFKRHMGSDRTVTLAGRAFTPEKLSSLVLRVLKEDAEVHLGKIITDAVITVPAYFNDNQRKATIEAGQIAGLNVRRIINEPTAAALAYGFHESKEDRLLLIFDLGGGTFDVSIVELFDGAIEVRASAGDGFLGGEDFTTAVAARLLQDQGISFEHAELQRPKQVSRLIHQCELAKRRLTQHPSAIVRIPNAKGEFEQDSPTVEIQRQQFDEWTSTTLARVERSVRRALYDAKLKREDIGEVIAVGGATRMPSVLALVTSLFGKTPHSRINPDEVVALGAAVQAALISGDESVEDLVVTDVAPFTLGIEISRQIGVENRQGYFLPIIDRNTTIPVSRVKRVSTLYPNQPHINVSIYQGESRRVADNLKLGEFIVDGIPRGPAGQEVDIRFTYDLNGILEVEALVVKTGAKKQHLVTKHVRGLSPARIQQALSQMQSLKSHPRDDALNRLLMQRAERLHTELAPDQREQLAELLIAFESAMELGDKAAIAEFQQMLQQVLDRFERGFDDGPQDGEHDDRSW